MGRISQETIAQIRNSADIVDVVSQYVNLKKRGKDFFGLCPFHHERTPSFSVAPDKEIYHCFGCGAGGSVFNFLMEHDNLTFVEAVQELGKRVGINVKLSGKNDSSNHLFTELYDIHETAANAYNEILFSERGKSALDYLLNRGLTKDSLQSFRVGFAPDSWDFLTKKVKHKQYSTKCMDKSGLFGKGKQGFVDRFRSRIMFPIMNRSGNVIAFGGRIFEIEDPAKYLNSPETPLYKKSDVFYGLHKTSKSIRDAKALVLVEGYTDLLQLYQGGIENIVAVSGTAFTARHALQIGKITRKVFLMYDGDTAGQKATLRAGYALLQNGIAALVVAVPDGLDPDDWIQKDGTEKIKTAMKTAVPILNFHLQKTNAINLPPVEKSQLVKEILMELTLVQDGIIRNDLLQTIANTLHLNDEDLIQRFKSIIKSSRRPPAPEPTSARNQIVFTSVLQKAQVEIIRALSSSYHEVHKVVKSNINLMSEPILKRTAELIIKYGTGETTSVLNQFEDKMEREAVTRILMNAVPIDNPKTLVKECLFTLKTRSIRDKIQKTRIRIKEQEATGKDAGDLIIEVGHLQQKLQSVILQDN